MTASRRITLPDPDFVRLSEFGQREQLYDGTIPRLPRLPPGRELIPPALAVQDEEARVPALPGFGRDPRPHSLLHPIGSL
jgi:hypothetical protein